MKRILLLIASLYGLSALQAQGPWKLQLLCPEEEACRIQRVRIKIREDGVHQLLHIAVKGRVRHAVNGKEHMELRPCRLSVFLPVIEAAVVDGKAYAGKCLQHIRGLDPIRRIF